MKSFWSLILVLTIVLTVPVASLAAQSPTQKLPPPKIEEIIEEVQTIYQLRVIYIYLDGGTAAPTHTEQLNAGDAYNVPSPEIKGYTPTLRLVSGVMPARNMEYIVIYVPVSDEAETILTFEDYENPLGLGALYMHVGICVE